MTFVESAVAALTVLSVIAYCAVAVLLWRFATRPSMGPTGRLALRFTAALLLFVLVVFVWSSRVMSVGGNESNLTPTRTLAVWTATHHNGWITTAAENADGTYSA